jgi:uncharacterized membrane protein
VEVKTRDLSIDALRGLVVFLMVGSHLVWFFGDIQNSFWDSFRNIADAVCYITFLFLFGISTYLLIFSKPLDQDRKKKIIYRILTLLFAYYIIAFVGIIKDLQGGFSLTPILETLFFINVPGFTEFMLTFVFYTFFAFIFKVLFFKNTSLNNISKKRLEINLITLGVVTFIVGNLIFSFIDKDPLSGYLNNYVGLFTYGNGVHRFPLLQYTPIFLLGLYFGYLLASSQNNTEKQTRFNKAILFSLVVVSLISIAGFFIQNKADIRFITEYNRWPPSIFFIIVGLSFSFSFFYLFRKFKLTSTNLFVTLGQEALGVLVFHLIIIKLLELVSGGEWIRFISFVTLHEIDSFFMFLILFIILLFGFHAIKSLRNYILQKRE